jgi:hypothetical protein
LLRRLNIWQAFAVGIVIVCFWDGVGYAAKGNSVAQGPSLSFLRNSLPFGMHTHGIIMLALGCAVVYTMHDRPRQAYSVMMFTFCYAIGLQAALFYGWYLSGKIVWSAPSKWMLVAWTALVLMFKVDTEYKRKYRH